MNAEIKALEAELIQLKQEFSKRVEKVEQRLNLLQQQQNHPRDPINQVITTTSNVIATESNSEKKLPPQNHSSQDYSSQDYSSQDYSSQDYSSQKALSKNYRSENKLAVEDDENHIVTNTNRKAKFKPQTNRAIKPLSRYHTAAYSVLLAIMTWLFEWFSPLRKIYTAYKKRDMLGIFILTLLGVALTLAGFGYLMQLLIDQLAVGTKSLLMFFAAITVISTGITIFIKTRFQEFATAIVALGLLLFYSTVYFAGSIYELIPIQMALFLYLFIALSCHILSLYLDTKVIASLGIIGIATIPMLSNLAHIQAHFYLLSLLFVSASSLVLAYRKVGHWLANLTLVFSLLAIEWSINLDTITTSVWLSNSFYGLFFCYVSLALYKSKQDELIKNSNLLIFLATSVGGSLVLFFQSPSYLAEQVSLNLMLNALFAALVAVVFYRIRHAVTTLYVLLAALWTILAIISVFNAKYWGIAWAVEGLLLFTIGRHYKMLPVVNQGQLLMAAALIYLAVTLAPYFPLPALQSITGWLLTGVIISLLASWSRLISTDEALFDHRTRFIIKPLLQFLEACWLTVLTIALANIYLGYWAGAFTIVVQVILLLRAKACQQKSIEYLAAFLIMIPLFYVGQGISIANSFQFMQLPLFAKAALLSSFAQLWLWSEFYRHFYPQSSLRKVAEVARIIFYLLLPVCWLGSALRVLDENILVILWLPPLIALYLSSKIQHKWLILETKLLTVLASLVFSIMIAGLSLLLSLLTLVGFTLFYALAYRMNKKNHLTQLTQFIVSWGIIATGFAVPNFIGFHHNSLTVALNTAMVYWSFCLVSLVNNPYLSANKLFIVIMNILLLLASWLFMQYSLYYAFIAILFIIAALYLNKREYLAPLLPQRIKNHVKIILHSIVAITYSLVLLSLNEYRADLLIAPSLAAHGALMLFLKDKSISTVKFSFSLMFLGIAKLAFIDTANALLWQKVILFIGIGLFILVASYWYQKIANNAITPLANKYTG
jgi:hypothetical protein